MSPSEETRRTRSGQDLSSFGRWLDRQFAERNLTPAQFARQTGIARQIVYQWRWRYRPSAEHCGAIAAAFGLPLETVLGQAGYLDPGPGEVTLRQRAKALVDLAPAEALPVLIAALEGIRANRPVIAAAFPQGLAGPADPAGHHDGAPAGDDAEHDREEADDRERENNSP